MSGADRTFTALLIGTGAVLAALVLAVWTALVPRTTPPRPPSPVPTVAPQVPGDVTGPQPPANRRSQ